MLACIQSRALRVCPTSLLAPLPVRLISCSFPFAAFCCTQLAHQGHHMASLATLFDPPQLYLTSLSLTLYRSWAQTIWTVLGKWAEREGSEDAKDLIGLFRGDEQAVRGSEEDEDEEERGAGTRAKEDVEGDLKKAQKFKVSRAGSLFRIITVSSLTGVALLHGPRPPTFLPLPFHSSSLR